MAGSIAKLKAYAKAIADAGTGYDQTQRWSFYQKGRIIKHKECDCSSFVGAAVQLAGYPINLKGTFYTGNLKDRLVAVGFKAIPFKSLSQVREGDILIKPGHHTELVYTPKLFLSAHIDEHGRASGGTAGDQTGKEVAFRSAYNYKGGWVWILRPPTEPRITASDALVRAAQAVIAGKYGTGDARVKALKLAGFNPDAVQAEVNRLLAHKASKYKPVTASLVNAVLRGTWGNGAERTKALKAAGYDPSAVQDAINRKLK